MVRIIQSCLTTGWQAAAVFILLSVSSECLQCYWCGPRAEQVHRSQRAPSCSDGANQLTACEPGYTHCAVVATSPPYAESRHCVKFYQDECYAQYCNSTRSYRMTCPCRGDLCNGPNTEREIAAFTALNEIVARIKRNAITSTFISADKAKMNNLIENEENADTKTNDDATQTEPPTAAPVDNIETSSAAVETDPKSDEVKIAESTTEAVKEMPVAVEIPEEVKEMSIAVDVVSTAESLKLESTTMRTPETTMQPTEMIKAEVNEIANEIKPSMQLPTAEALQQNASPVITTEKVVEQTTGPPTPMTTENNMNSMNTPMPTESKNKSAAASLSALLFLSNVAFTFYS